MSLQHVGAVLYDAENKDPYMVMILLSLADFADSETGESYRSIKEISKMSRCSDRQTQNYLRLMCELGWIEVSSRTGTNGSSLPNRYRLIRHHKGGAQYAGGAQRAEGAQQIEREASPLDGSPSLLPHSPSSSSSPSAPLEEKDRSTREAADADLFGASNGTPDSFETLLRYCRSLELAWDDATHLWGHWQENGFRRGKAKMKDWKRCVRTYATGTWLPSRRPGYKPSPMQEAYFQRQNQEYLEAQDARHRKQSEEWETNATPADREARANFLRLKNEEPQ